jgi:toxin ParE1/3/4
MAEYRLSIEARNDLIRIHHYGVEQFGLIQADLYFASFFDCFESIARNPYAFEAVDNIRQGYRRCSCGADTIYYRVCNDIVEIMAVIGRQDLDKTF